MPPLIDLTGQRFGRLKVVRIDRSHRNDSFPRIYYHVRCDCGGESIVQGKSLRKGDTKSCGCLRREVTAINQAKCLTKHGDRYTAEYQTWCSMRKRCTNPNMKNYKYYGARGISVCARWDNSYENFLADMGRRPSSKHSIDRVNNNGNYEPSNCRWATAKQQIANQRRPVRAC